MMRRARGISVALAALLASACASSTDFELLGVQSLAEADPDRIAFPGLEFLADTAPGEVKPRVNVVYLHGIGWTEDPDIDALGQEFIDGLASAYGIEEQINARGKCLSPGGEAVQGPQGPEEDRIFITAPEPIRLETALPGAFVTLDRLACVDVHELDISDTLEIAVYRIFWDDAFWNGVQFFHVGQDDARGSSLDAVAGVRRAYNRRLKDEIVNFGFSDAVMYLGPTGEIIRDAVRGAVCASALHSGGVGFERQGPETSYDTACRLRDNTGVAVNRFAFVSESLGSKIIFDLMRDALDDGREGPLDPLVKGSNLFMLANQIPLLSLSDLTPARAASASRPEADRPRIIAFSEPNDLLTYEVVPFFRQVWRKTDGGDFDDAAVRREVARRFGFDVVDLRVAFADPLLPLVKGLVDPLQAHKEHAGEPEIMRLILCGMRGGRLREDGCLAAEGEFGGELRGERP